MPNGLPPGSVADIKSTFDLKIGDILVIEGLGWIARQYLGAGDPAHLVVFGFNRRPGISTVGVRTPSGKAHWFDDGTKNELLAALKNQASFNKLYVWRPTPAAMAEEPDVLDSMDFPEFGQVEPPALPASNAIGPPPTAAYAGTLLVATLGCIILDVYRKNR